MYRLFFHLVLRWLPAEFAHSVSFAALRALAAIPPIAMLMHRWLAPRDPQLRVSALGREFPGPLGLAAGFDKDATGVRGLAALGFAFVEVGTVTNLPQPGNPKPRLFRLIADRALLNRMGFNNSGAQAAADRLRRRPSNVVVGVNIGKSKVASPEQAVADFEASASAVADVADYVVVNVSSPNTPGLRDLQQVAQLRPLLVAVRGALDAASSKRVPLLVKIAPDLADDDIDAIAALVMDLRLDGVIAVNTTISRDGLRTDPAEVAGMGVGGVSGGPLRDRARAVLVRLRTRLPADVTVISVGGIETADDVRERLAAGATLVQAYTGLIYGGPLWPARIHRELIRSSA